MFGRRRRDKASDIFRRRPVVFATQASFAEAFPSVERAEIEVEEAGAGLPVTRRFSEVDAREFVDCSNPACYGGGVSVGAVLRAMIVDASTEVTHREMCRGYEGSHRRRVADCRHVFTVHAALEYRAELAADSIDLVGVRPIRWRGSSRATMAYLASRNC